jgi:hypothetical protein
MSTPYLSMARRRLLGSAFFRDSHSSIPSRRGIQQFRRSPEQKRPLDVLDRLPPHLDPREMVDMRHVPPMRWGSGSILKKLSFFGSLSWCLSFFSLYVRVVARKLRDKPPGTRGVSIRRIPTGTCVPAAAASSFYVMDSSRFHHGRSRAGIGARIIPSGMSGSPFPPRTRTDTRPECIRGREIQVVGGRRSVSPLRAAHQARVAEGAAHDLLGFPAITC